MKYKTSDQVEVPHGNSTVWRYMNTSKFKYLINNSALYFPNAIRLSDQYEATIPSTIIDQKRLELQKNGLSGSELERKISAFTWETNPMKEEVLINCWSVNPHENYALWKIYLGNEKNGVAIKTTVSKLKKSVTAGNDPYPEDFFMGKVKYRKNLHPDELSRHSVITTKKPFYEFEKEIRLFILNNGAIKLPYVLSEGREVKVSISELINEIYISPFSDVSYHDDIKAILSGNGLNNITLKQSEILDK